MTTATDMRDLYLQAEREILLHGQSSSFAGRALTTADLPEVQAGRREWERRAADEAAATVAPGRRPGISRASFGDA